MDKTLEIIMVAMTLVVAAVVVVSMLQGQSEDFGSYADGQRTASDCGMGEVRYQSALNCDMDEETEAAKQIRKAHKDSCDWATSDDQHEDYCPT